jgi:uncharacterized protein YjbJ (UPF0337 family)
MKQNPFKTLWDKIRPKVAEKWPNLTQEDLESVQGEQEKLCTLLENKCGYTKPQANDEVRNIMNEIQGRRYA